MGFWEGSYCSPFHNGGDSGPAVKDLLQSRCGLQEDLLGMTHFDVPSWRNRSTCAAWFHLEPPVVTLTLGKCKIMNKHL